MKRLGCSDPDNHGFNLGAGLLFGGLGLAILAASFCMCTGIYHASMHFGSDNVRIASKVLAVCGYDLPPQPYVYDGACADLVIQDVSASSSYEISIGVMGSARRASLSEV